MPVYCPRREPLTTARRACIRRAAVWFALLAYAAFVAYMSLKRFSDVPLDRAIDAVGRAYLHLPAYAGLAILVVLVLSSERVRAERRPALACAIATTYGWLLEVAQIFAPTRSFNVLGLLFDLIGATMGTAAVLVYLWWWKSRSAS
jgi:VanZ family protein